EARELDLYFEYFERLHRDLHRPDKVICFTAHVDRLIERIQTRGRAEESAIQRSFLEGLNGYYSAFPSICETKYGVEVLRVDVSEIDIRSGDGRRQFLEQVSDFLHH
ncbi:MAG: deoxynucleoside kinase, partial [Myxococcota bacterium]